VIDHWIQDFPALQKEAITTALDRASLTKARRAVRLLEELDAKFRGPSLTIAIPAWDSLASVQLVAELQEAFHVDFELEEIESLRSYDQIYVALSRRGISLHQRLPE